MICSVLFCMCDLSLLHHVLNWKVFYVDLYKTSCNQLVDELAKL